MKCTAVSEVSTLAWLLMHSLIQVVLTVSQIMWCRDLTNCLTRDDGHVLEAVQDAEQRCFQVGFLTLAHCARCHKVCINFWFVWCIVISLVPRPIPSFSMCVQH